MSKNWLAVAAALVLGSTGVASGADWGDLTLTFTLEGKAPAAKAIAANKDPEVCGKHKLVDEALTVGEKGGIADVFVYLRPDSGKVPVHPDYEKLAKSEIVMDNKGCRFEPHAAVLWTSQTLVLKNSDPIGHNVKGDVQANPAFNPIIPAGGSLKISLKAEERLPAQVSCSIHPWMSGRLLVRDNPYAAVSDKDGKVVIKNVPAGDWKFQIWHEAAGYIQEAKDASGKSVKWSKGRADWKIKKGANDLGTFKVDAKAFAK